MRLKTVNILCNGLCVFCLISFLPLVIPMSAQMNTFFVIFGIVCIGLAMGLKALLYRCPHCRKSLLNAENKDSTKCPYCGKKID